MWPRQLTSKLRRSTLALSDPITITVNAVAKVMPRIATTSTGNITGSTYATADGLFQLEISHTRSKGRVRSLIRFTQKAIVTNPLDSTNDYDTLVDQRVLDRPDFGFTATQLSQQVAGFSAWEDSTIVGKLFGGES